MIGLDTNILVRYLTQDDPAQSRRANRLIESELSEEAPGFVSTVVIAEIVWVLQRTYRLSAPAIAVALERMLQIDVLVIENEQQVFAAMIALKQVGVSFADALIGELAAKAGCSKTVTFDRKATRLANFALL